jgi:glycosyltransferase involved in cell wall biosynthesis
MKILVCSSYRDAWNSVRPEGEIFIGIAKRGHSVTVMTQRDAEYADRFIENGVEVIDCYPQSKFSWTAIRAIRAAITEAHFDIVYAMNSRAIANTAMACVGLDVKFVTYRGTVHGPYRRDPTSYLTHLHPRVDGIICNADAVRDQMRRQVWRDIKIETVYKGQEVGWFDDVGIANLEEFGISADDFVVLCVANARPSKGIDVLLAATHHLSPLQDLQLVIIGRGVDSVHYQTLARNSPMAKRVHLLGYRSDAPGFMAAANLYVQPSVKGEGMSKTVAESMANRIPAVVTTTGGTKELVADGKTGFTVPVSDPPALAERIAYLHDNRELCEEMGNAARRRLEEDFATANSVDGHIRFFEELIRSDKKKNTAA